MTDQLLLKHFLDEACAHHARFDPSHDFYHVRRVTLLALSIAHSLANPSTSGKPRHVDLLVVQLAALAHDMLDKKYLPKDRSGSPPTAKSHLARLYKGFEHVITEQQQDLVARIVDNVSYSKEVKRIAEGKQTQWHETCLELHCVQDADKLDAIGAMGVMRCSAYSGVTNRPLHIPPTTSSTSGLLRPSSLDATDETVATDSAIDHFDDKLFKLEGMMKTQRGKELARQRTEFMRVFVEQTEREWRDIEQGLSAPSLTCTRD
ncbi:hypothetical protein ACM66B_005390 [Microbotryomycetes sp. NB124-2]